MASLINAGQRVTADNLNKLIPLNVVKAADQHYTNTTFAADGELFLSVDAGATYLLDSTLFYEGGTTGASDMKIEWLIPSGATLSVSAPSYYFTDGGTHGPSYFTASSAFQVGTQGAGAIRPLTMTGALVVGNTAGTLQLMAAKNSSSSTDTIIHALSFLALQQIA